MRLLTQPKLYANLPIQKNCLSQNICHGSGTSSRDEVHSGVASSKISNLSTNTSTLLTWQAILAQPRPAFVMSGAPAEPSVGNKITAEAVRIFRGSGRAGGWASANNDIVVYPAEGRARKVALRETETCCSE